MGVEKVMPVRKPKPAETIEAWRTRPVGYPRFAERMGVKPETLLFRKFTALQAQTLLYMQAELIELERDLQAQEEIDLNNPDGNHSQYSKDFRYLRLSCKDGDTTQLDLVRTIQEKLKIYHKALIRQHRLSTISGPDRFDITDIQYLLVSEAMDSGAMIGEDSTVWGQYDDPNNHAPDLVCVCPRENVDTFSRIVAQKAIHLFKYGLGRMLRSDPHLNNVYYDSNVVKMTRWIATSIASLIPMVSIVVLTNLHSQGKKLWTIAAFNVVFTFCLAFFTKAKPAEIFTVTVAFAAVQVVFLAQEHDK